MKKTYKYDREGRRSVESEEENSKEIELRYKHKQRLMPLWIILVLGLFILMLAISVDLTARANQVEISCKVEGIHQVPTYSVFLNQLDYMPFNLDCTYKGPMPK